MGNKNTPIVKKKIKLILKESGLEFAEMLTVLDDLSEQIRKKSRSGVQEEVKRFVTRRGAKFLKAEEY